MSAARRGAIVSVVLLLSSPWLTIMADLVAADPSRWSVPFPREGEYAAYETSIVMHDGEPRTTWFRINGTGEAPDPWGGTEQTLVVHSKSGEAFTSERRSVTDVIHVSLARRVPFLVDETREAGPPPMGRQRWLPRTFWGGAPEGFPPWVPALPLSFAGLPFQVTEPQEIVLDGVAYALRLVEVGPTPVLDASWNETERTWQDGALIEKVTGIRARFTFDASSPFPMQLAFSRTLHHLNGLAFEYYWNRTAWEPGGESIEYGARAPRSPWEPHAAGFVSDWNESLPGAWDVLAFSPETATAVVQADERFSAWRSAAADGVGITYALYHYKNADAGRQFMWTLRWTSLAGEFAEVDVVALGVDEDVVLAPEIARFETWTGPVPPPGYILLPKLGLDGLSAIADTLTTTLQVVQLELSMWPYPKAVPVEANDIPNDYNAYWFVSASEVCRQSGYWLQVSAWTGQLMNFERFPIGVADPLGCIINGERPAAFDGVGG